METSDILVVDDDSNDLELAARLLIREGMRVCCAASGDEALRKLTEKPVRLMLTDLNMPGMDGLELARRARSIAPEMTIVMWTALPDAEICRRAREAGIAKVAAKPLHLAEVLDMLTENAKAGTPPSAPPRTPEGSGWRYWKCPECGADYTGWSLRNECSKCGCREVLPPNTNGPGAVQPSPGRKSPSPE